MKTKNNFNLGTVLVLLLLCQPVFAYSGKINVSATGKLTGKIIDKTTQLPMENISVVIYSAKGQEMVAGTLSNSDGSFHISMLEPGSYFLEINLEKNKVVQFPEFSFPTEKDKIDLGELSVLQKSRKHKPVKDLKK